MDRRSFMKVSTGLSAGLISSLSSCQDKKVPYINKQLRNWAGNIEYHTTKVYYPSSVDDIRNIISTNKILKCQGTRHSFSRIADSVGCLVATDKMKAILDLNENEKTVTVEPGITYGELSVFLHEKGYAVQNLASLPHISVAGACATATHGSGVNNGILATSVKAVEIVDGTGKLHSITANDGDLFNGVVVNLGALGIVTKLTLSIIPDFKMSQVVYRGLPFDNLKINLEKIMSDGYSVSLFTNWAQPVINQVWVKKVFDSSADSPPSDYYGASKSDIDLHPVESQSAESVTTQRGIVGTWFERLPHFKMGFKPSTGNELQSEFFVDKERAFEAMETMQSLGPVISPHLLISEIRSIKSDEFWMSPAYKKDCVAIHTTWLQTKKVEDELIPMVQNALHRYDAIPHWAKLSNADRSNISSLYPRIKDFRELCMKFDPDKKFQNDYLRNNVLTT